MGTPGGWPTKSLAAVGAVVLVLLAARLGSLAAGEETRNAQREAADRWAALGGEKGIPVLYAAAPGYARALEGARQFELLEDRSCWLKNPAARAYRSGLLLEVDDTEGARSTLEDQPSCGLHVRVARLLFGERDLSGEQWALAQALLKAELAYRQKDWRKAEREARLELGNESKDAYSIVLREGVYSQPFDRRAIDTILARVELATPSALARSFAYDTAGVAARRLAIAAEERGEPAASELFDVALRYFNKATDAYSDNATSWSNKGDLQYALGLRMEETMGKDVFGSFEQDAVDSFEKAGMSDRPLVGLAALAYGALLEDRARDHLPPDKRLNPSADALAAARKDLEKALDIYRQAQNAPLPFADGIDYESQRPREDYCPGGRDDLDVKERFEADLLCSRGAIAYQLGDFAAALSAAQRGFALCGVAECANNLGCAQHQRQRYPEAATAFGLALKAWNALPEDERDHRSGEKYARRLSDALRRAGNAERAAAAWRVAESLGNDVREERAYNCRPPLPLAVSEEESIQP